MAEEALCDVCGGPLGEQRWRGFPPICGACEMESLHDTPDLSGPYIDTYIRLRDIRNTMATTFHHLEEEGEPISPGTPLYEVIEQIEDLSSTFLEAVAESAEDDWDE